MASSDLEASGDAGEACTCIGDRRELREEVGRSSLRASRIPLAISKKAALRSFQLVIAFAFFGRACSLLKGVSFQSTTFRIMGITRASPNSCRSNARFISIL